MLLKLNVKVVTVGHGVVSIFLQANGAIQLQGNMEDHINVAKLMTIVIHAINAVVDAHFSSENAVVFGN